MSYTDYQHEFRELASWVVDQAKKAGANDCRVSISKNRFVEINYRSRKPETIKEATTQGLRLEIYKNNRFSSQSTPDFRKSTLSGFISDLVDNTKIMEEDPFRTLPDPKYFKGRSDKDLDLVDTSYNSLEPEMRHDMVKVVENACIDRGGNKVISVEAGEYDQVYEEFAMTSNGFEGSYRSTEIWTGADMTAQDEGDRKPNGYYWVGSRHRNNLPSLKGVGEMAAIKTLDLLGAKKIETETLPVIIENDIVSRLLSGLVGPMSAGNIQQKRSFLADKKGQAIGSKLFTIIDDPFIPQGFGSKYYDGDGFPARKREFFTQGVLNEFLIDWYYGRKLGWEPTSGSTSNVLIPPGTRSVDSIIKDMDRCLLVTGFLGGNSNPTTGDFSVGIQGKLYNKGQFVQNVAEMNLADNHLKFWNKLIEIGNDPWMYSNVRTPSLVFDGVVVAGI